MEDSLINKVAQSGLVTLNLELYFPEGDRVFLDIKDTLFMGMVLKEKDFRTWIKEHNWAQYESKHVAVGCSIDAIIPTWAYMLIGSKLSGVALSVHFGNLLSLENELWFKSLQSIDFSQFEDAKMVIKGCSDKEVSPYAYVYVTEKLVDIAQSVMFGEPCSTVPVYKRKKAL
jgi:hypothetical protein